MKERTTLKPYTSDYYQNKFSHIYVEQEIKTHPVTLQILSKQPEASIVEIENYAHVFNRPRQQFTVQKQSPKLILAQKKIDFVYPGSVLCENFGNRHFYYSANILNCLYDCKYCYLQGMYGSANVVIFVNTEAYFEKIDELSAKKDIYLCLSYDSDLLAFENITGFASKWIDYAAQNKKVLLEIRTKSANFKAVAHKDIPGNIIFAWTLSPDIIVNEYENKTPSLEARLKSVMHAVEKGLQIRLSFEPLMDVVDFEYIYSAFIQTVFKQIPAWAIRDVNIGVFRMSKEHYKRIEKSRPQSKLFAYPVHCQNGHVQYAREQEMKQFVVGEVQKYLPAEKIF